MFFFGGMTFNFFPVTGWWHYFGTVVSGGQVVDFSFTPRPSAEDFVQLGSPC